MLAVTTALATSACPSCGRSLVVLPSAAPWCAHCEHGLGVLETGGDFGWRWLDRLTYRFAFRATMAEAGRTAGRTGNALLIAICLMLYAQVAALLVVGVWLCTLSFPGFGLLPGVTVILIAIELRPRLGRLPKYATVLAPDEVPELRALVARVAAAVGAQVPDTICLEDDEFNAAAGLYGARRRRLLVLGLPLWNALAPQERVALLGHELGHYVNGDVRRGVLVQPAYTMLDRITALLTPAPMESNLGLFGFVTWVSEKILGVLLAVLRGIVAVPRLLLLVLAYRQGQRAEYRADGAAVTAAGSVATVRLLDLFVLDDTLSMLVKREARSGAAPATWPATVGAALDEARPKMALRRQLSARRDTSLFASHPPSGLRARVVDERHPESASVVLDTATNGRIDAELARHTARSVRTLKSL
jgi:Zn-dependent protease with chaperone function